MPKDLYHIFERLDFLSGEKAISLSNRGDGIKARHIPLILRFMAEKKAELKRRGGAPISSIWAYEEPENNLEMASAIQLADELHHLAVSETAQIILTTHSPAFYDLGQNKDGVKLNFVTRDVDTEGTVVKTDVTGIDESLGTLAMLTSRISEMVEQVRRQEASRITAERLATSDCHRIFVEGESDKIVLSHAMHLFFPEVSKRISFETKDRGAGHQYVIDMLTGWRSFHKHHPHKPKAAGVVDGDASKEKKGFNEQSDNVKSAKCFTYPESLNVREARKAHFNITSSLENLYPKSIWDEAEKRGHLKDRKPSKVCKEDLIDRLALNPGTIYDELTEDWAYLVKYEFAWDEKISTAKKICRQSENQCRETLKILEPLLKEIIQYFGLL